MASSIQIVEETAVGGDGFLSSAFAQEFEGKTDEELEKEDKEKLEGEEEEGGSMSAMKDSAEEGMVSAIKSVEEVMGVGDPLSSAFAQGLEGEEQDENAPEEIELRTGVNVTVINDADIEDNNKDKRMRTCCGKALVLLAALFVLPIVSIFDYVLSFSITNIDAELAAPSSPSWMETMDTSTLYNREIWTPYSSRATDFAVTPPPWTETSMGMSTPYNQETSTAYSSQAPWIRKRRSRSLCDLYVWTPACRRVRQAAARRRTDAYFDHKLLDSSELAQSLSFKSSSVSELRHKLQAQPEWEEFLTTKTWQNFHASRGRIDEVNSSSTIEKYQMNLSPFPSSDLFTKRTPKPKIEESVTSPHTISRSNKAGMSNVYIKLTSGRRNNDTNNTLCSKWTETVDNTECTLAARFIGIKGRREYFQTIPKFAETYRNDRISKNFPLSELFRTAGAKLPLSSVEDIKLNSPVSSNLFKTVRKTMSMTSADRDVDSLPFVSPFKGRTFSMALPLIELQRMKNLQPSTEQRMKNLQPSPERRKNKHLSSTEQRMRNLQPSTERRKNSLQSSTEQIMKNLQPSTEQRMNNLQPSTEQRMNNLQPSTEQGMRNLQPSTERRKNILQSSTERRMNNLPSSTERRMNNLQPSTERRMNNLQPSTERRMNNFQLSTKRRKNNLQSSTERRKNSFQPSTERTMRNLQLSVLQLPGAKPLLLSPGKRAAPPLPTSFRNEAEPVRALRTDNERNPLKPLAQRKAFLPSALFTTTQATSPQPPESKTVDNLSIVNKPAKSTSSPQSAGHKTNNPHPANTFRNGAVVAATESGGHRAKRAADEYYDGYEEYQESASGSLQYQAVADTYKTIYGLFGIISGIAITVFNYRLTAVVGSWMSGGACLIASFLSLTSLPAMTFVLGVLPGMGNNLLVTSAMVALLEHFRERPLRVLSIQDASGYLSEVLFILLQAFLFPEIGVDSSDWRGLLQYQAATYAICLGGAAALVPLNMHMRDAPGDSVRGRMLNISGLAMLRSPVLYALAAIFFFTSLGGGIPKTYIEHTLDLFLFSKLLVICMALGSFLGSLVSSCVAMKPPSLVLSLVLIAILGSLMGLITLSVEVVKEDFLYAIAYSGLFGLFAGLRLPLMKHIIPLTLGEEHLGLAVGLTTFSSGLGSIIGDKSAAAIMEDYHRVDAVFYLSGLGLLASTGPCLLLLKLVSMVVRRTTVTSPAEQGPQLDETENSYGVFTIRTETDGSH